MLFPDLLIEAIRNAEIPLRFEPGAEEAVARPVTELLKAWLEAHQPPEDNAEFTLGQRALLARLLGELQGAIEIPQ